MQHVISELRHIRKQARRLLIAHRAAQVVSWTITAMFALIVLDYFVRLPEVIRLSFLLGGIGTVIWGLGWYLGSVIRFSPTLTQIALRAEQSFPSLQGRLASSLEFVTSGMAQSNPLAARSVVETQTRMQGASVKKVLAPQRALRDVVVMMATTTLAILLTWVNPVAAGTGLMRYLLPFSGAQWPARTGVESLMHEVLEGRDIFPRGVALPLRAQVTKGANDQRIDAHFRIRVDGALEDWQQIVLTHQSAGVQERLVATNADMIEFYFQTADAQTRRERVKLVPPPSILSASLAVTPPAYASGRYPPFEAQLGPGIDERAATDTPSLIGSDVRLAFELNKALPVPDDARLRDEWARDLFGWDEEQSFAFEFDGKQPRMWTLRWRLDRTRAISPRLTDEYGLTNSEPITYRIDAVNDFTPSVTITEPQSDEAVTASAIVPLVGEATDDVAVSRVGLEAALDRVSEDVAEENLPVIWAESRDVDAISATIETELKLEDLNLAEGDVVLVTGVAQDMYELDGMTHEPVHSSVRRLRIISELDMANQLRRQLGAVRHNAIRIESMEAELQDDVIEAGVQSGISRAQTRIGDRIAAQQDAVQEIREVLDRNQLDDAQLEDLLRQSEDLLDFAGRASTRAAKLIEQREARMARDAQAGDSGDQASGDEPREGQEGAQDGQRNSRPGARDGKSSRGETEGKEEGDQEAGDDEGFPELDVKEPAEEDREIVEQQQEVRDEMADLIELLDRDEDTWVITSQTRKLLEDQEQLAAQTNQLGRRTLGQTIQEMSEEDKTELDRIRDKQMELRDRARQLIDSARERAEAMEEHDPQSAAGMRAAADQAEERELDRDMEKSASRVSQNQLQKASGAQQRAMETLKRMLEELEETDRAKTEQLLRQLASLIESIDRLITIQENELTSLNQAAEEGNFTGRDRAMIRLNQNTQSVAGEARAAGQESRRIARALDRAADAQGAAVIALRARPLNAADAELAENRSLELLQQARKLAEDLQQQTQEDETRRQREALIDSYRGFAEQEVVVREESLKLSDLEDLNRRQLVDARRLGNRQEAIRAGLSDLRSETRELFEAKVFSLVHRAMDNWSLEISDSLKDGRIDVDVTDRQLQIIDSLGRLIAALEESMVPPDEFAQDQENQSGGSGSQAPKPLIPPVAELKLLQGMQEQVYTQTRELDSRDDLDEARQRSRLRDLGQQQRDLLDIGQQMLEQLKRQRGAVPTPVEEQEEN